MDDYTGNSSTYVYDDNGNMKTDGIRGTTTAYFSSLNLPDNVFFGNDNRIFYYYTAGGTKVGKHVKPNSTNPQGASESYTHYIGNIVYEGGKLSYIITEEGRLIPSGTGSSRTFVNEYNLKDHLGNNRVTFMPGITAGSLNIVQKAHYYPFGLVMKQTNEYSDPSYSKNKYLYNGKEYQDETLNQKFFGMYDYGARFYDPQIGRFHTQDRFAEKYLDFTPYQYAANNPILYIDVNGDSIVWGQDQASQELMQKILRLTTNSSTFSAIYEYLANSKTVYNISANDKLVQSLYQKSSGGLDPNGKSGGVVDGKNIIFSEIYADDVAFSEEFFHQYQIDYYSNSPRATRELEPEAKLMNTVIGIETDWNSKYTGKNKIIDNISNMTPSSLMYQGNLYTSLSDASSAGSLEISQGSQLQEYYNFINNFSNFNNQTQGNVYGGTQRALIPAAYNSIIQNIK